MHTNKLFIDSQGRPLLRAACAFFLSMALAGCTTFNPYLFAGAQDDPTIIMSSDFPPENYYSVNTQDVEKNHCADFKAAGVRPTFNLTDALTSNIKHTGDVTIKAPADQKIAIQAAYGYRDNVRSHSCSPNAQIFTPQKNHTYLVRLKALEGGCRLTINSVDAAGHLEPIPTVSTKSCFYEAKS